MRKLLVLTAVAATGVALSSSAPAATTITVGDNFFSPKSKTVRKGTTVVWRWSRRADDTHTVTVVKGPVKFSSASKTSGSYRRTMRKRGVYRIVCSIHPDEQRMKLTVQ